MIVSLRQYENTMTSSTQKKENQLIAAMASSVERMLNYNNQEIN